MGFLCVDLSMVLVLVVFCIGEGKCETSPQFLLSKESIFRKQNTYPEHSEQELLVYLLVPPPTTVTLVFLLESGPASEGRTVLK